MTTKFITTYVAAGYTLSSAYSELEITASGTVGGTGVLAPSFATILNEGAIRGGHGGIDHAGIELDDGGVVRNYGSITASQYGVDDHGAGTITNMGGISSNGGGVLALNDTVVNGSASGTGAEIFGNGFGVYALSVTNWGTIAGAHAGSGPSKAGVKALHVVNGSISDTAANIVGYNGVCAAMSAYIANYGTIRSPWSAAIRFYSLDDSTIINGSSQDTGALIVGAASIVSLSGATISNFGIISGYLGYNSGIQLALAGVITNGSANLTQVLIEGTGMGIDAGSARVANFGSIVGRNFDGICLNNGGEVVNGGSLSHDALIQGGASGLYFGGGGALANYGQIEGGGEPGVAFNGDSETYGHAIFNAAGAAIQGYGGINASSFVNITNYGRINGLSNYTYRADDGIRLAAGGTVNNLATDAFIQGTQGICIGGAPGAVLNYGRIYGDRGAPGYTGSRGDGVQVLAGGSVMNGSTTNSVALIEGSVGVDFETLGGSVANFGRIIGDYFYGVSVGAGCNVTNGSAADHAALITGYGGVDFDSSGSLVNFGTVTAVYSGNHGLYGLVLAAASGGNLINGSAADAAALIQGYLGVIAKGAMQTITNFGTIDGIGGTAVDLLSSSDTLVAEAGSGFTGSVLGDGATLDLDSGSGMLAGLISSAGDITVSGSMAPTNFTDFATLEIGAAATFATSGAVVLAAGQSVIDFGVLTIGGGKTPKGAGKIVNAGLIEAAGGGVLTIAGALANSGVLMVSGGSLQVTGAVSGAGQADIQGGALDFLAKSNQAVAFGKGGALQLGMAQGFTGKLSGFGAAGTLLDLSNIAFISAGQASFSGNKKSGVLTVTDGKTTAHITLLGDYLGAAFVCASDGQGGTTVQEKTQAPLARTLAAPPAAATPSPQAFTSAISVLAAAPAAAAIHALPIHGLDQAWLPGGRMLAAPRVCAA